MEVCHTGMAGGLSFPAALAQYDQQTFTHHHIRIYLLITKLKRLPPIHALSAFEAVARQGSFSSAAEELHLSQSAVSKQVRTLEEHTRCPVFRRHARGIELTSAGAALLQEIQPALAQLSRGIERVRKQHDASTVSVIATHAVSHYWLFPKVIAFNREHPDITVSIQSDNAMSPAVIEEYDFGILYGRGDWPGLEARRLFPERVYPVCRPDLALPEHPTLQDLKALALIELDSSAWDCIDWVEWFAHFDEAYRPKPHSLNFNQVSLSYNAALEGLGVSLGWDFMVSQAIREGRLRRVGDFVYDSGKHDFLVHGGKKSLKPAAQTFKDWLS
ncbi:LysR substrate-binding domain-containing protein [Onishia taeanensis]